MGHDLLDLELKLLILKHGRTRLLESLAHIEDSTPDQIEHMISQIPALRPRRKRKEVATAENLVDRLGMDDQEKKGKILTLAREYEHGRFLPQLRDAIRFCLRHGIKVRAKSRRELLPRIVSLLAAGPVRDIERIMAHSGEESGSFERLANALMKGV